MKQNGFELAYECIDELDDTLSDGALVNQNEVWCNLNSLDIDYFFSTADRLTEQLGRKVLNQKVIVLKNAVNVNEFDYRRFQNAKIPEDLVGIIKKGYPIVGYYGAMSPWLDYELIHKTAKNNPDYSFVFIGVDYAGALSRLDQSIKNVYYLGAKKQKELPLYSVHFSCATIPFCSGEIAKSTSPIKLFEYMAMGLPVVCTRDLNECKGYKYVYVAKNDKEFEIRTAEAVKESGNGDVKDVLYKQAEANTWDSRANVMIDTFGL